MYSFDATTCHLERWRCLSGGKGPWDEMFFRRSTHNSRLEDALGEEDGGVHLESWHKGMPCGDTDVYAPVLIGMSSKAIVATLQVIAALGRVQANTDPIHVREKDLLGLSGSMLVYEMSELESV